MSINIDSVRKYTKGALPEVCKQRERAEAYGAGHAEDEGTGVGGDSQGSEAGGGSSGHGSMKRQVVMVKKEAANEGELTVELNRLRSEPGARIWLSVPFPDLLGSLPVLPSSPLATASLSLLDPLPEVQAPLRQGDSLTPTSAPSHLLFPQA